MNMPKITNLRRGKPIRRVSKKRAAQLREYARLRAVYLRQHPYCEVWLSERGIDEYALHIPWVPFSARSTEIHHKAGRTGWRLNDTSQWLAVCREAHEWIHDHPAEARKRGYLI